MADKPHVEVRNRTIAEAAEGWHVSQAFVKRARSHGLIRIIYMGDKPLIPAAEFERIARDGLPNIPPGYKRQTTGPTKAGRPRKAAKPKPSARRKSADERRVAP